MTSLSFSAHGRRFVVRASRILLLLVWICLFPGRVIGDPVPASPGDREAAPPDSPSTITAHQTESHRNPLDPGRFNLSMRGGTGPILAVSPYVLPSKKVAVATSVLNVDRDPGDLDFMQYNMQVAVGVLGRAEFFASGVPVLRTNSVNQDPVGYPVPPLDLFVDIYPTPAIRQAPYFLFVQEAPFKSYYVQSVTIDPPGHGAFGVASGEVTMGTKVNLLSEDRGNAIGLGVRGYVDIPTEPSEYNVEDWRHSTGTAAVFTVGV